jgi:predicted Zn finger-like uncharacterized protein
MIQTTCPLCQTSYKLPDTQAGKRVRCKSCSGTFLVQAEEEVPVLEEAAEDELGKSDVVVEELPVLQDIVDAPKQPAAVRSVATPPPAPRRRERDEDEDRPVRRHREEDRSFRRDRDEDRSRPMRRDQDEDDRDDWRRDPEPQSGSGGLVLILGACAVLFALLAAGGGLAWYFASSSPKKDDQAGITPPGDQNPNPNPNQGGNPVGNPPPGDKSKPPDDIKPPPPVETFPEPKDVKSALTMLEDPRTDARRVALGYLKRVPPATRADSRAAVGKAVKPLLTDREVGEEADSVLRNWHCKESIPKLEEDLTSNEFKKWMDALDVLGGIQEDKAAEILSKQLLIRERTFHASTALKKQGKRAEKYVVKHLHDRDFGIRETVRNLLRNEYRTAKDVILEQTVADLSSDEEETRKSALLTLSKQKVSRDHQEKVSKALEGFLTSPDGIVRRRALQALNQWATADNLKAINGLLLDRDSDVRDTARLIVGRFKSDDSIEPLVLSLGGSFSRRELRVIRDMILAYGEKAEKAVQVQLRNDNALTRGIAFEILGEIGTKDSLTVIQTFGKADRSNMKVAVLARKKILAREKAKAELKKEIEKDK